MPKDDMHIIIYKILEYLYGCNKEGKATCFSDIFNLIELPNIPQSYLAQILQELIDNRYIANCSIIKTKDGIVFVLSEARITMSGIEYLKENSLMKKAREVLGKAFVILLETIIKGAI